MSARPVLLIDEDVDWCARVCRFLEPHGIRAIRAGSIDAAAESIEHLGKPGALIMDIANRRETRRAVSAIRADASLLDVPVGYVKKSAALDSLLLMLMSSATVTGHQAA